MTTMLWLRIGNITAVDVLISPFTRGTTPLYLNKSLKLVKYGSKNADIIWGLDRNSANRFRFRKGRMFAGLNRNRLSMKDGGDALLRYSEDEKIKEMKQLLVGGGTDANQEDEETESSVNEEGSEEKSPKKSSQSSKPKSENEPDTASRRTKSEKKRPDFEDPIVSKLLNKNDLFESLGDDKYKPFLLETLRTLIREEAIKAPRLTSQSKSDNSMHLKDDAAEDEIMKSSLVQKDETFEIGKKKSNGKNISNEESKENEDKIAHPTKNKSSTKPASTDKGKSKKSEKLKNNLSINSINKSSLLDADDEIPEGLSALAMFSSFDEFEKNQGSNLVSNSLGLSGISTDDASSGTKSIVLESNLNSSEKKNVKKSDKENEDGSKEQKSKKSQDKSRKKSKDSEKEESNSKDSNLIGSSDGINLKSTLIDNSKESAKSELKSSETLDNQSSSKLTSLYDNLKTMITSKSLLGPQKSNLISSSGTEYSQGFMFQLVPIFRSRLEKGILIILGKKCLTHELKFESCSYNSYWDLDDKFFWDIYRTEDTSYLDKLKTFVAEAETRQKSKRLSDRVDLESCKTLPPEDNDDECAKCDKDKSAQSAHPCSRVISRVPVPNPNSVNQGFRSNPNIIVHSNYDALRNSPGFTNSLQKALNNKPN